MEIDKKTIQIIKSKYWKNGWIERDERCLSESDTGHLESNGWNLGKVRMTHDSLTHEVIDMSKDVSLKFCASLLSNSLATRSLYDRSFLSSVVQSQKIPIHKHTTNDRCKICGLYNELEIDQDVMLFEKIMWGGVRLTSLEYVWLDLKLLKTKSESFNQCEELSKFLTGLESRAESISASKFSASLKEIKGNKAEREILCGILGICDILQHPDHPGFLDEYPLVKSREMPNQHYIDLEWPYCWYNSAFGVNFKAFNIIKANKAIKRTATA